MGKAGQSDIPLLPLMMPVSLNVILHCAVGYGSRGYGEAFPADPHRNVYLGVSINVSALLSRTAFRESVAPGRVQRTFDTIFDFVQVPGTVALKGHRL